MSDVPQICFLDLCFRVLSPIDNLPHFHGAHISALFRHLLKPYLPKGETLSSALITPVPVETGILSFSEGETFHVGLSYPKKYHEIIISILKELSGQTPLKTPLTDGHFVPGKTIILEDVICRITNDAITNKTPHYLTFDLIEEEIELLGSLEGFSLLFYTPLRLVRPKGIKASGHRFCDDMFFFETEQGIDPIAHIIHGIENRLSKYGYSIPEKTDSKETHEWDLKITDGGLIWIDCPYGYNPVKTIGGVTGKIKITGKCTRNQAITLVMGQYTHLGKNTAFGFGAYIIPEVTGVKKIKPLSRGKNLLERALEIKSLENALSRLPNSSPGIDGISVTDVKKAGISFLERLKKDVLSGAYTQGELKRFKIPKDDGKFRDIYVQCVSDRLIHKAIADYLAPVIDRLLLNSAWAYRKGFNRMGAAEALSRAISEGYTEGIKADIATFFDSVNIEKLSCILEGLFPYEPVTGFIKELIEHFTIKGIKGLPQGSPLSPVLSNLYLTCFDRDMEKQGFMLIRYSDDFVILSKDNIPKDTLIERVQKSLKRLDLTLKEEKVLEVCHENPIRFLGYLVSKDGITEKEKDEDKDDEQWLPVFRDDWIDGQPVYLTSLIKGAYSDGADLIVKSGEKTSEKIPWNTISRLVVAGRAPVSGGLIYRALKEEIPVVFIDVLGRQRGSLYPEYKEMPDIAGLQSVFAKDKDFILSFAKEIISAKIHNSYVLLKRNGIDSQELKELEKKALDAQSIDSLRGYEGTAARIYFSEFAHLVMPFEFKGRVYHPPDCPVNVMLSLGYTLLYNRISSMLKNRGFNTRLGFYHKGRGAHNALASDLMEALRHIVERIVLSLIHLKEITKDDFTLTKKKEVDMCRMEGEGFRKFIKRFEKTMAQKASYHGGEKMSYNAYLDEMADSLRRSFKLNIPYKALRID